MTKRFFTLSVVAAASCLMGCTGSTIGGTDIPDSQDKLEKCAAGASLCPEGTTCNGTVCLVNAQIGEKCSSLTSYCKGGECVEGKCKASDDGKTVIPCGNTTCIGTQRCERDQCISAAGLNEACDAFTACAIELKCNPQTKTCMIPIGIEENCDIADSYCVIGTCSPEKKCEATSDDDRLKLDDSDGDTISDYYDRCDKFSNPADSGTADCRSQDSDGDTIPDKVEALNGGNIQEEPYATIADDYNFMSIDSDRNGVLDSEEACPKFIAAADKAQLCGYDGATGFFMQPYDTDGDTIPDYASMDNDSDRLDDATEIAGLNSMGSFMRGCDEHCASCDTQTNRCAPGTAENPWDTNGDTIPDYLSMDSDGDTIPDFVEFTSDSDRDGTADRYSLDSDGDTIPDKDEIVRVKDDQDIEYIVQIDQRGNEIANIGTILVMDASGEFAMFAPDDNIVFKLTKDQIQVPTFSKPLDFEGRYCFQSADCDHDGLTDNKEVICKDLGWSGMTDDIDGDGYKDAAEYVVAQYAVNSHIKLKNGKKTKNNKDQLESVEDMMCDPNINVKDIFDYYFDLPVGGDEENDLLMFIPEVSKLDLVFNVDTTQSMDTAIRTVRSNIKKIYNSVKDMVSDSAFALTNFDDFPVALHGNANKEDLPFRVIGSLSKEQSRVEGYVNNSLFDTRYGADNAESGVEALYQIATGAGTRWNAGSGKILHPFWGRINGDWESGSIDSVSQSADAWGAVGFRRASLPMVIHITDVYSHDEDSSYNNISSHFSDHADYVSEITYEKAYIPNPHYTADLIPVLKQKGIRVITMNVGSSYQGDKYGQMTTWSRESNAIVPACAFASNKCDLGEQSNPVTVNGYANQCILKYKGGQDKVADFISEGVNALVKYGTYEVATVARTDPNTPSVDTSCFIKRVEAVKYYPPENEPEKSCNPVAKKDKIEVNGSTPSDYENGFSNFATGTSQVGVPGAKLEFKVVAQNLKSDGSGPCVESTSEAQVFTAYIDVINPITGLVFGTRPVSIIVPAVIKNNDN